MFVTTRSGKREPVQFDKITHRISHAEVSAYMTSVHPDYARLAGRIAVANLHRSTSDSFVDTVEKLYQFKNEFSGEHQPLVSKEFYDYVKEHKDRISTEIAYSRDFEFDYFGFKTLERSYLLKVNGKIVERPQHLFMRVALGVQPNNIEEAIKTYHLVSEGWFTHASPTLFNAGTNKAQMSSCFLLTMKEDSIDGIYETLKQCALISQSAGGIGLSIHNIRGKGSFIKGTNGTSNGIVPMLRVFNDTARYVDQGGGKRKGAFAIYLEPWHSDVEDFLELKKNHGKEELRARDLFYALWINDLFMKRVETDGDWTLMCPNKSPGLADCYGEKFEKLYLQYENEGRGVRTIKARDLWYKIIQSQIETGSPFMLYKDHANEKSNQKNLGTIKSSNLCTEIMQYTSDKEIAVCNLASIALPKFVVDEKFDHKKLFEVTYQVTRNLNRIIDLNYYPVEEARYSNMKNRPIGIGVQGLADAFFKLRVPFDSEQARSLNKEIFETIYYASLTASTDLAKEFGAYESYEGSPVSQGLLQHDLWGAGVSARWDWTTLRAKIKQYGVRNSLLLAPMPTASTSQILGNNECIEPITSNIYTRRVLAGEFAVVNKYLVKDLMRMGLWNEEMKDRIIAHNGSVQYIQEIPTDLKELYRTVWEIKQKSILEMAADRGAFIDQSQSLNIHMEDTNFGKLSSLHFAAWKLGLKTGMYYLRTRPAVDAIKFTIKNPTQKTEAEQAAAMVCSLENPEACVSCGS